MGVGLGRESFTSSETTNHLCLTVTDAMRCNEEHQGGADNGSSTRLSMYIIVLRPFVCSCREDVSRWIVLNAFTRNVPVTDGHHALMCEVSMPSNTLKGVPPPSMSCKNTKSRINKRNSYLCLQRHDYA